MDDKPRIVNGHYLVKWQTGYHHGDKCMRCGQTWCVRDECNNFRPGPEFEVCKPIYQE